MKIPEPKRWWFPALVILPLILQGIFIELRWLYVSYTDGPRDIISGTALLRIAGLVAHIQMICFPLGLWGLLIWSNEFLAKHCAVLSVIGWASYLGIVGAGIVKPRRAMFAGLLVMILLNIGGCQLPHVSHTIGNMIWKGD